MRQSLVIAFIAVVFWNTPAESYGCGEWPLLSTTMDDGTEIGLFVTDQQVEQTQKWSPQNGAPPLPLTEAIEIAIEWAEKEYSRYDSVKIHSIDLQEIGCSGTKGHWSYIFSFRPVIDGNALWGPGNLAAVLMDGTVIRPTEKP